MYQAMQMRLHRATVDLQGLLESMCFVLSTTNLYKTDRNDSLDILKVRDSPCVAQGCIARGVQVERTILPWHCNGLRSSCEYNVNTLEFEKGERSCVYEFERVPTPDTIFLTINRKVIWNNLERGGDSHLSHLLYTERQGLSQT
jgi:hypothetical protein